MPDRTGAESETRNSGRAVLGNNPKLLFRTVADNLAEANRLFDMMHGDRYAEAVHNDHKHNPAMLKGIDTYTATYTDADTVTGTYTATYTDTDNRTCIQTHGLTGRQSYRQADMHTYGHTYRQRYVRRVVARPQRRRRRRRRGDWQMLDA